MPSILHESTLELLVSKVTGRFARTGRWTAFWPGSAWGARKLDQVYQLRSASFELPGAMSPPSSPSKRGRVVKRRRRERVVQRSPDSSFYHPTQPHLPCTVVEIGYSQTSKQLWTLGRSYIEDSNNAIKCVIIIDLPYPLRDLRKGYTPTVSIWRAKSIESHPITLRSGIDPLRNDSFSLYARDFLPDGVVSRAGACTAVIEISITSLACMLSKAVDRMVAGQRLQNSPRKKPLSVSHFEYAFTQEAGGRMENQPGDRSNDLRRPGWCRKLFGWS